MASLNHPHVLRVFDWGEDTDGPYLVLEYLGGGSLRDLLDRGVPPQPLPGGARSGPRWRRAWPTRTSAGWCTGTSSRRTCSSTRRAGSGWPTSAWPAPWPRRPGPSRPGAMVGTARYISPEAAEGKPVDGRADVYSLALVLYEARDRARCPSSTDTTMGTLMARIGAAAAAPTRRSARSTTSWPGPPRPMLAARLDAAGLAARLGALASALPTPAPLPLVIPRPRGSAPPITGFRAPGRDRADRPRWGGGGRCRCRCRDDVVHGDRTEPQGAPVGTKAGSGRDLRCRALRESAAAAERRRRRRQAERPRARRRIDHGARAARGGSWRRSRSAVLVAGGLVAAFEAKVFTASHPRPTLVNLPLAQARAARGPSST